MSSARYLINPYAAIKDMRPKPSDPAAAPPPPPTVDDTAAAQQDYQDQLNRRRGSASTILTDKSTQGAPTTASKTLLGQ